MFSIRAGLWISKRLAYSFIKDLSRANIEWKKNIFPIPVPVVVLCILPNKVLTFIWNIIQLRVNNHTLHLHKLSGGFGVPCLLSYYRAAQIASLTLLNETKGALLNAIDGDNIAISTLIWLPPTFWPSL